MNLKEEIRKAAYPISDMIRSFPESDVINFKDAIRIAESYAKEKAWEAWEASTVAEWGIVSWENISEYDQARQREIFEKWWEENK